MYRISLTSIPPRFNEVGETLESLLAQDPAPDAVTLYLPSKYDRYPDWDGTFPDLPERVELRVVENDWGPATKIIPAIQEASSRDSEIIFCDDDRVYAQGWASRFLDERRVRPKDCIALAGFHIEKAGSERVSEPPWKPRLVPRRRVQDPSYLWRDLTWHLGGKKGREPTRREVRTAGYCDIFQGYGGVMVRPEFFPDVIDDPGMCRFVDDVWLSAEVTRSGVGIWVFADAFEPEHTASHRVDALFLSKFGGLARNDNNIACIQHFQKTYGIW